MKTFLSDQQTAFFTKNGSIEFEQDLAEIYPLIGNPGRDLWRANPPLQKFILKKLGPIALALTGKKQLRLGCDQMMEDFPSKPGPLKDLFCLQRIALVASIAEHPSFPKKFSPLGIFPLPHAGHVLFFKPELILDWPHVKGPLYLVLFTLPNAVYAHNPNDPSSNYLKPLGYNYGDVLKSEFHPLIF